MNSRQILLVSSLLLIFGITQAQNNNLNGVNANGAQGAPLTTSVQFLTVAPDARSAGMSDIGAATSPDIYSMYWNPAKLALLEEDYGVGFSYTPWLKQLVNDMWVGYLAGYMKFSKEDALGVSLQYFDLGTLEFRDENNQSTGDYNPREMALGLTYSRILTRELSLAATVKYINSNLSSGQNLGGTNSTTKPGNTAAVDVGVYWHKDQIIVSGNPYDLSLGLSVTNLGGKITYTTETDAQPIPTNIRGGVSITRDIDLYNRISFIADLNYLAASSDTSLVFGEELKRRGSFGVGAEYWYVETIAARLGYHHESQAYGNRKYASVGLGIAYKELNIDVSYLIPITRNSPLQNTLRISLAVYFKKPETSDAESITE